MAQADHHTVPNKTIGSPGAVGEPKPTWKDGAMVVCLVLVTVATLWPVVTCDFLNHDDHYYLSARPRIQQGLTLANLGWVFTQSTGYYDPIDLLSHMLDCQLFGMNAAGHHASNLFYHTCNVMLLFLLLRRTTGQRWCSAFAAVLFAVHPQNVQAVAWISGRRDVLSTLFALLALLAYARYASSPNLRRYVFVTLLLLLSMMVKPAFIPFPAVLLVLDYWPLNRMEGVHIVEYEGRRRLYRLVTEKIPWLLIVLGFAVAAYITQTQIGALASFEVNPLVVRTANAANSYVMYAWKALWPTHFAVCYPYDAFSAWKMMGMLGLLVALTTVAALSSKQFPYLFTGWFWYVLVLAPFSGFTVQLGNESRADRYAYVATIGLFIAVTYGMAAVIRGRKRPTVVVSAMAMATLMAFAAIAHAQVRYWKDSETLFRHALDVTENNALAYGFLGRTLAECGRDEEAVAAFEAALRISPYLMEVHVNYGDLLYRKERYAEAVQHFDEALRHHPKDENILYDKGLSLLALGKRGEAIACFRQAVAIKPDFVLARNNLGYALAGAGRFDEAVGEYREALRIDPASSLVLYNLGDALVAMDKYEESIPFYERAAEADLEKRHEAFNRIGETLVRLGKHEEAAAYFDKAVQSAPWFIPARVNWGRSLADLKRYGTAEEQFMEVLRQSPENAAARDALISIRQSMQNGHR